MARLAIDVRPLTNPIDGIGRFTFELVTRLLQHTEHEWILYSHIAPRKVLPGNAHTRTADTPFKNSLLCSQCLFPQWLKRDRIDAFWSPRHHLPMRSTANTVVTIHDLCWLHAPGTMPLRRRAIERLLMPQSLRRATRITAISHSTATQIVQQWPELEGKLTVIGPGARTAAAGDTEGDEEHRGKPYILSVGTVEPRKNYQQLIAAFAEISDKVPHDLIIAGRRGWHGVDINSMAARHRLADRIHWREAPSDSELHQLYRDAALFVTASTYEGFNLPILEAMTHGLPLMASDLAIHREVAGDCAVFAPLQTSLFANAMLQLSGDRPLQNSLRQHCPEQTARYDWDASTDAILDTLLTASREPAAV
jgi:glycosyltransferase involved in cell wall biosynthesis